MLIHAVEVVDWRSNSQARGAAVTQRLEWSPHTEVNPGSITPPSPPRSAGFSRGSPVCLHSCVPTLRYRDALHIRGAVSSGEVHWNGRLDSATCCVIMAANYLAQPADWSYSQARRPDRCQLAQQDHKTRVRPALMRHLYALPWLCILPIDIIARRGDTRVYAHVSVAPSARTILGLRRATFLQQGGQLNCDFLRTDEGEASTSSVIVWGYQLVRALGSLEHVHGRDSSAIYEAAARSASCGERCHLWARRGTSAATVPPHTQKKMKEKAGGEILAVDDADGVTDGKSSTDDSIFILQKSTLSLEDSTRDDLLSITSAEEVKTLLNFKPLELNWRKRALTATTDELRMNQRELMHRLTLRVRYRFTGSQEKLEASRSGREVGLLALPPRREPGSIPAGPLPDFRMWESRRTMPLVGGFSRGSPVSPTLSFRRCSALTSITLIGSQDLAVKSRPKLFTHCMLHKSSQHVTNFVFLPSIELLCTMLRSLSLSHHCRSSERGVCSGPCEGPYTTHTVAAVVSLCGLRKFPSPDRKEHIAQRSGRPARPGATQTARQTDQQSRGSTEKSDSASRFIIVVDNTDFELNCDFPTVQDKAPRLLKVVSSSRKKDRSTKDFRCKDREKRGWLHTKRVSIAERNSENWGSRRESHSSAGGGEVSSAKPAVWRGNVPPLIHNGGEGFVFSSGDRQIKLLEAMVYRREKSTQVGAKRGGYGAASECKDGVNGRSPRKPADQWHSSARFPARGAARVIGKGQLFLLCIRSFSVLAPNGSSGRYNRGVALDPACTRIDWRMSGNHLKGALYKVRARILERGEGGGGEATKFRPVLRVAAIPDTLIETHSITCAVEVNLFSQSASEKKPPSTSQRSEEIREFNDLGARLYSFLPIPAAHWLSVVTVEGDDWVSFYPVDVRHCKVKLPHSRVKFTYIEVENPMNGWENYLTQRARLQYCLNRIDSSVLCILEPQLCVHWLVSHAWQLRDSQGEARSGDVSYPRAATRQAGTLRETSTAPPEYGELFGNVRKLLLLSSICFHKRERLAMNRYRKQQHAIRSTAFLRQGKQSFCLRPPVLRFPGKWMKVTWSTLLSILGALVAERLVCSPPTKAIRVQFPAGSLRIFTCGNRGGRCRWSAGFLGDLPFPPPPHSGAVPYSPQSPSSALKTPMLRDVQIPSLTLSLLSILSKGYSASVTGSKDRVSCPDDAARWGGGGQQWRSQPAIVNCVSTPAIIIRRCHEAIAWGGNYPPPPRAAINRSPSSDSYHTATCVEGGVWEEERGDSLLCLNSNCSTATGDSLRGGGGGGHLLLLARRLLDRLTLNALGKGRIGCRAPLRTSTGKNGESRNRGSSISCCELMRVKRDEYGHGTEPECKVGGKREIPEKTRRLVASYGTIPTCDKLRGGPSGESSPVRLGGRRAL
ncbi:hypothetical protein PR048_031193 [Dryococelus australis]|uniref:Uncharacterized protein n=1 Tax=Dryococelus australis TaxID=614101 RepID=A0ABQ9G5Q1_9NEOP|nr:hypothetical protein PR048_031193 [Dryococelus australis]